MADSTRNNADPDEIARFAAMADTWWDPQGPMRPLHRLNPTRLAWLRDTIASHFGRDVRVPPALSGLSLLDIGCGAGLVSEPMSRMGATVTGLDLSQETISAARHHADAGGLTIAYRAGSAEDLAATGATFDVVLALEVVEHVPDVPAFVGTCARLVAPGGLLLASTINRTGKAYALAIVGAEYVLRWLPRGTHRFDRLVTPSELSAAMRAGGLTPLAETGVAFNPLRNAWTLARDMDVNYMMAAARKA